MSFLLALLRCQCHSITHHCGRCINLLSSFWHEPVNFGRYSRLRLAIAIVYSSSADIDVFRFHYIIVGVSAACRLSFVNVRISVYIRDLNCRLRSSFLLRFRVKGCHFIPHYRRCMSGLSPTWHQSVLFNWCSSLHFAIAIVDFARIPPTWISFDFWTLLKVRESRIAILSLSYFFIYIRDLACLPVAIANYVRILGGRM